MSQKEDQTNCKRPLRLATSPHKVCLHRRGCIVSQRKKKKKSIRVRVCFRDFYETENASERLWEPQRQVTRVEPW